MAKLQILPEGNTIKISGTLDEEAQFPQLKLAANPTFLDLNGVTSVNSVGIRNWLNWITPLSQQGQLIFKNVPHCVVLQINMIEGFLPKTAQVESFYVPIYSEEKDEEAQILLEIGKDIQKSPTGAKVLVDVAKIKGGGDWEFDVVEKTYFKFLNS